MNCVARRVVVGVRAARTLTWRWSVIGAALVLAFAAGGCGGGSSSGSSATEPSPPPQGNAPPNGRGKLIVTATDVLGQAVAGATVRLSTYWGEEDRQGVTDAGGVAQFDGVIADRLAVIVSSDEVYGITTDVRVPDGGVQTTTVVGWPVAPAAGGITAAASSESDISDEGRTLEFTVGLLQVPTPHFPAYWAWGPDAVRVMACVPDASDDTPRFLPDCVAGADGFDSAYDGFDGGRARSLRRVAASGIEWMSGPAVVASALLIDQGGEVGVADPADRRLFAAKYFLALSKSNNRYPLLDEVALAAFAQDDGTQGQSALLPQQPVTVFPVENPGFTTAGRELFPAVEALASLEGGASPLMAAIDRMLDFAGNRKNALSSVVVMTDGRDDTCGTRPECLARVEALVKKSRDAGVAIVPVALPVSGGAVDYEMLGALAQANPGGVMFRAEDPDQLVAIYRTALRHLQREEDELVARFRIHAEAKGTFAPGRTVLGKVRLEVCPWDCYHTYIPFAVRIP